MRGSRPARASRCRRRAERFNAAPCGQPAIVENDFDDDTLEQSESLDSDEVRNDDGDAVVDPPDKWIKAEDNESLDQKLAAETDEDGAVDVVSDDDNLDNIDPDVHGRESGQIDGTPEDGDSFFDVQQ
jgi:hypothetical protein